PAEAALAGPAALAPVTVPATPAAPVPPPANGDVGPVLGPDAPSAATGPAAAGSGEHRPAAERAADTSAQSEATLVYGAAKALRNSGDPGLAAKLLDDYARRYPRGALSE